MSCFQVEVVVTTAIGAQAGDDQPGIRVVKVSPNKLSHQFYATPDIPDTVHFD